MTTLLTIDTRRPADINDMYVGQSEARTKALFSLSRRLSPCIIFIDEAESLLGSRGGFSSGNAAHRQVLTGRFYAAPTSGSHAEPMTFSTEFMQEMDGLTSSGANKEARVSVVAATNRPFVSRSHWWSPDRGDWLNETIHSFSGHGRGCSATIATKVRDDGLDITSTNGR